MKRKRRASKSFKMNDTHIWKDDIFLNILKVEFLFKE